MSKAKLVIIVEEDGTLQRVFLNEEQIEVYIVTPYGQSFVDMDRTAEFLTKLEVDEINKQYQMYNDKIRDLYTHEKHSSQFR